MPRREHDAASLPPGRLAAPAHPVGRPEAAHDSVQMALRRPNECTYDPYRDQSDNCDQRARARARAREGGSQHEAAACCCSRSLPKSRVRPHRTRARAQGSAASLRTVRGPAPAAWSASRARSRRRLSRFARQRPPAACLSIIRRRDRAGGSSTPSRLSGNAAGSDRAQIPRLALPLRLRIARAAYGRTHTVPQASRFRDWLPTNSFRLFASDTRDL